MSLSEEIINASVVPEGKTQLKISDGGGLFLLIRHSGKYWKLAYRFDGKQKTLSFGVYPQVSLEQARIKREEAKYLLTQKIDPSDIKKEQKQTQRLLPIESNIIKLPAIDNMPKEEALTIQYDLVLANPNMLGTEERRLVILQSLAKDNGNQMNEIMLQATLNDLGIKVSFDRIRTDMAWLNEQQVVTLNTKPAWLVHLTQYGLDVVNAYTWVPGIKQPT